MIPIIFLNFYSVFKLTISEQIFQICLFQRTMMNVRLYIPNIFITMKCILFCFCRNYHFLLIRNQRILQKIVEQNPIWIFFNIFPETIVSHCLLIRSPLQQLKSALRKGVATHEWSNLVVFYDLDASEIWFDKRGGFWWGWGGMEGL